VIGKILDAKQLSASTSVLGDNYNTSKLWESSRSIAPADRRNRP